MKLKIPIAAVILTILVLSSFACGGSEEVPPTPTPTLPLSLEWIEASASWEEEPPFDTGSQHIANFVFENISDMKLHIEISVYFADELQGGWTFYIEPGMENAPYMSFGMPLQPGTYDLKLAIREMETETDLGIHTISSVQVE